MSKVYIVETWIYGRLIITTQRTFTPLVELFDLSCQNAEIPRDYFDQLEIVIERNSITFLSHLFISYILLGGHLMPYQSRVAIILIRSVQVM